MPSLLGISAVAFALAAIATPAMRALAQKVDLVDRPHQRKGQSTPIPLLGGAAVMGAFFASQLAIAVVYQATLPFSALLGALAVGALGLVDDRRGLGAGTKLVVQMGAAMVLVVGGLRVALPLPFWVNVALTLFWVVGITNALNLLDNMDGLASGVAAIASATMAALALSHGQLTTALSAGALAATCVGFLLYNFAPASIYLGDCGSLFLGFLLAAIGIELRFPDNTNTITWMVPVLILGVAIFDTTLVCWSRLRRNLDPLRTPGHDHLSHRLVFLGLSSPVAVVLIYLSSAVFSLAAWIVSNSRGVLAYGIALGVALLGLVALVWLERPSLLARIEHARET